MRRTLLAATATTALAVALLAPPPAQAAANSYVVQGHPITAAPGLALVGDTCAGGGTPPTVTELELDGGAIGGSALGWSVNQAASEAGPAATLAGDPDLLSTFELSVHAPAGTTGHAYVRLDWDADTYYVGWSQLAVPAGGWWQFNLSDDSYSWFRYDAGTETSYAPATIQQFITGPGFTSAKLGALFGCGGEQFYVDRLVVANAENSSTYDFEKKPLPPPPPPAPAVQHHVAHLEWSTDGKEVHDGNSVTIRYGQSLWMLGHGHVHADSGNIWYSGLGTLSAEATTASAPTLLRRAFDQTHYAAVKVAPAETTIYRFTADAHEGHAATSTDPVTVHVASRVRAKVRDRHLVEGQNLVVKGQVGPEVKGVKVTLQRKVGSKWLRLTTSKTRKGGKFTLTTRTRTPGTWKVRVKVATTSTNVGTTTGSAKVQVDRYIPPKPKQPPPPPSNDSTPESTAPVATPVAPQVTSTAPVPPDRPTPTGRVEAVGGAAGKG